IQVSAPLADGTYTITAQATDPAGNVGPMSAALTPPLVIATAAPTTVPSTPSLLPADDGGVSNSDHITNVTRPHFQGTADPSAFVHLFAHAAPHPAAPPHPSPTSTTPPPPP